MGNKLTHKGREKKTGQQQQINTASVVGLKNVKSGETGMYAKRRKERRKGDKTVSKRNG